MSRTFRKILPILGVVIALGATSAFAQSELPAEMRTAIDAAANAALKESGAPGASIAVVRDGRIAYVQAYGDAQLEPRTPARPAMRYSIGSVSKQFTATAILMLAEEGKLSLDDPVSQLPARPDARERRHDPAAALAHLRLPGLLAAGLRAALHAPGRRPRAQILDRWAKKPLDFEPGTQYQYSNTGYVIAGVIVEKASGTPLLDVPRDADLRAARDGERRATSTGSGSGRTDPIGYMRYALGPPRVAPKEGKGWLFAAGELAMTAEDLARWNVGMIEQKLLKPASYRQMQTDVAAQERPRHALRPRHRRVARRDGRRAARARRRGLGVHGGERRLPGRPRGDRRCSSTRTRPTPRRTIARRSRRSSSRRAARRPAEARAREIFEGLQQGKIDRSLFTVEREQLLHRPGDPRLRREPRAARAPIRDQADAHATTAAA